MQGHARKSGGGRHRETVFDNEPKSNDKASDQELFEMSEADVYKRKTSNGSASEMQKDTWPVAVRRHRN